MRGRITLERLAPMALCISMEPSLIDGVDLTGSELQVSILSGRALFSLEIVARLRVAVTVAIVHVVALPCPGSPR